MTVTIYFSIKKVKGFVGTFHKIIESQNGLGWRGSLRLSNSNPPAMGRDATH